MPEKRKKTLKSGYDAIVVGSGIVGAYLARRIAESGHKVLMIDKRSKDELGVWKNSGHNLDKKVFEDLDIDKPSESELGAEVDYADYLTTGESFKFKLPMYNVKLAPFSHRMVDDAVKAGVKYQDRTKCTGAFIDKGKVAGINALRDDEEIQFRSALVIDVSGIGAVVRKSLPDEFGMEKNLTPRDYLEVYAEDHEVDPKDWPVPFTYHSDIQGWSGPRRKNVIGLGLGRFGYTGEDPAVLCRELAAKVVKVPSEIVFQTRARVPVRHALYKLVAPGLLMLGDSAFQGKPLNGEGISVMLYAAEIAAEVIDKSIKNKDNSEEALWPYCVKYHRDWGARFAPFHRLRYELLRFSKAEQSFMLGLGLYGPEEMSSIMLDGKLEMTPQSVINTLKNGWRALARPDIVIRLVRATVQGQKLKKLYEQFPGDPKRLPEWAAQVDELFQHD